MRCSMARLRGLAQHLAPPVPSLLPLVSLALLNLASHWHGFRWWQVFGECIVTGSLIVSLLWSFRASIELRKRGLSHISKVRCIRFLLAYWSRQQIHLLSSEPKKNPSKETSKAAAHFSLLQSIQLRKGSRVSVTTRFGRLTPAFVPHLFSRDVAERELEGDVIEETASRTAVLATYNSSQFCSFKSGMNRPWSQVRRWWCMQNDTYIHTHTAEICVRAWIWPPSCAGSAKIRANGRVLHVGMSHSLVHSSPSFLSPLHEGRFHCSNVGWLYAICWGHDSPPPTSSSSLKGVTQAL